MASISAATASRRALRRASRVSRRSRHARDTTGGRARRAAVSARGGAPFCAKAVNLVLLPPQLARFLRRPQRRRVRCETVGLPRAPRGRCGRRQAPRLLHARQPVEPCTHVRRLRCRPRVSATRRRVSQSAFATRALACRSSAEGSSSASLSESPHGGFCAMPAARRATGLYCASAARAAAPPAPMLRCVAAALAFAAAAPRAAPLPACSGGS